MSLKVLVICHNVLGTFVLFKNSTRERPIIWVDLIQFIQHEGNFRITTPTNSPDERSKDKQNRLYVTNTWGEVGQNETYIEDSIMKQFIVSLPVRSLYWLHLSNAELFFITKLGLNYVKFQRRIILHFRVSKFDRPKYWDDGTNW